MVSERVADSLDDIAVRLVELRNRSDTIAKELSEIKKNLHDIANFLTTKPLIQKAARAEGE